jgi:hypothetical protein
MRKSNTGRARKTMTAMSLAMIVALLAAIVFAAGVAEAKGGGGGRGGGGGSSGKPSATSSKPSNESDSSATKSGASGVTSSRYGVRHGSLSNFFLWAWIFHDFDDDDYEEEYGSSNAGFGGWAIAGVGVFGVWFLIHNFRKRFGG